jgi:hypothetical protein
MEEFVRPLFDLGYFSPEMFRTLTYLRYAFILMSAAMFVSIIYFVINTRMLREKYIKDILEFTQSSPYKDIKIPKNWNKLTTKAVSEESSERKLAIIEADEMLTEVFNKMGYEGDSLKDSLEKIEKEIVPNRNDLFEAHEKRKKLLQDPNYEPSKEEAREIMNVYRETLEDLQLL